MIDGEGMPATDRGEHRPHHILRDIVNALASGADEMVVMLGIAGDVRGHVPITLEAAGHPVLDLLLERAVDGCSADRRVCQSDAVVELLR
jgi:hypothetical protein